MHVPEVREKPGGPDSAARRNYRDSAEPQGRVRCFEKFVLVVKEVLRLQEALPHLEREAGHGKDKRKKRQTQNGGSSLVPAESPVKARNNVEKTKGTKQDNREVRKVGRRKEVRIQR